MSRMIYKRGNPHTDNLVSNSIPLCVLCWAEGKLLCNKSQTIHRRYFCWLQTRTIISPSNVNTALLVFTPRIYISFSATYLFKTPWCSRWRKYASFETSNNNNPITQHHHYHHHQNNNIMEPSNIVRKGKNCATHTKIVVGKPITRSLA